LRRQKLLGAGLGVWLHGVPKPPWKWARLGFYRRGGLGDYVFLRDTRRQFQQRQPETMKFGSLCALGGFTPYPVMSAIEHFPEDFGGEPLPLAAE